MIEVLLNKPEFEYDIHSLVKAFFPEQYVGVSAEKKEYDEKIDLRMQVNYGEDTIEITWQEITQESEMLRQKDADVQANEKPDQEEVDVKSGQKPDQEEVNVKTGQKPGQKIVKEIPGGTIHVDFSDRVQTKNHLKQMLYRMLCDYTKRTLPWGTLTGIRPTKIPMKLLEEGKSREEIYRYMKDTYFASDEKIELATDIAERENAILKKIDYDNGYSLYIGIPFCPTTCLYCSFTSYPLVSWRNRVDLYLDALEKEIDYTAAKFYHKHLNSIYIGGGTPTTLEPYQLDRLIRKIKCSFDLSDCLEFTVEAGRPDSITREKLEVLRKWGITRISINPQTMQQRTLDLIGRRHSVEQTIESFKMARELGFDDINMDLIMGLPEESLEDVQDTLEQIMQLKPDNLTVHSLALKRAARLNMFKEDYKDYKMVNTQEHMDLTASYAEKMDLKPYYLYRQKGMAGNLENVGYAKEGKEGVYNILIMEEKQTIVACGAGASTKRVWTEPDEEGKYRIERCENVKDVAQYIERIDEMIERKKELFTKE